MNIGTPSCEVPFARAKFRLAANVGPRPTPPWRTPCGEPARDARKVCAGILIAGGLVTQVVSGTAVSVLMMPIATSISETQGIDPRVLGVIVIFAANWAFATPFGTPSNLMAMTPLGPGEASYAFADYVRFGGPLQIVLIFVTLAGVRILYGTLDPEAIAAVV